MSADVLNWFETFCPVDNPSGGEATIRERIAGVLKTFGASDQHVDAKGNLFVKIPGDAAKEVIMLSAHMDSVPPCHGIVPVRDERNGRAIIRSEGKTILGADDKSGIATIVSIIETLSKEGFKTNHPLELFFSTEEEIGLNGAKGFDMKQSKAAYCYVLDGEGRVGLIFNEGPSQENIQVLCTGRASHAGIAPEAGISAIQMGAELCATLPTGRLAPDLTSNIGVIKGGNALNIVAPELSFRSDARSLDDTKLEDLLSTYRSTCAAVEKKYPGSRVEMIASRRYNHFKVDPKHVVIQRAEEACRALNIAPAIASMNIGSDAHILNANGLATVVLGMGFHYSHSLGEFIYCEELAQVYEVTLALVR